MKKNPWIAAVLNFFFMGLGTLYIGRRKLTGLGLTLAAVALTRPPSKNRTGEYKCAEFSAM